MSEVRYSTIDGVFSAILLVAAAAALVYGKLILAAFFAIAGAVLAFAYLVDMTS